MEISQEVGNNGDARADGFIGLAPKPKQLRAAHSSMQEALRIEILAIAQGPLGARELGRLSSVVRRAHELMIALQAKHDQAQLLPSIAQYNEGVVAPTLSPIAGAPLTETYGTAVIQELVQMVTGNKKNSGAKAKPMALGDLLEAYEQAKSLGLTDVYEKIKVKIDALLGEKDEEAQ